MGDLEKFDGMVRHIKDLAIHDLKEFLDLHGQPGAEDGPSGPSDLNTELKPFEACCAMNYSQSEGILEK